MKALEKSLQWLRPLVRSKTWDYCVVWKLGDDPSRFIEWVGCCCAGAHGDLNVKVERAEEHQSLPICRDTYLKHPAKTKTCGTLSRFTSSIPLYSGIHGEVVISTEPRWLSCTELSNSNQFRESTGTQVLIPVVGGLIELFSAKHIPKDQNIIEFITAQYSITMEQEAARSYSSMSLDLQSLDPLHGEYLNNWPAPLHHVKVFPRISFPPTMSQPTDYLSIEGPSTGSNPSNEHPTFSSGSNLVSPNVLVNESKPNSDRNMSSDQGFGFPLRAANLDENDNLKSRQKIGKEQYCSKNLVTERNRRNRIKDGLYTLRSLVPKISKMDRAAILGDAIEYIEELQKEVKELQDELKEMTEEKCEIKVDKFEIPESSASEGTRNSSPEQNQDTSSIDGKKQRKVQVEVNQLGTRDFLLQFLCKQKKGGFMRLMETMNSSGFQVIDANVTTFNGKVLNILKVEVNKMEVHPKLLEDSLIKLTSQHISSVEHGDSTRRRS